MNERHTYSQTEFNELLKTVVTFPTASDSFVQNLSNSRFISMDIQHIDVNSKEIHNSEFEHCSIIHCNFYAVTFTDCTFTNVSFHLSDIISSIFKNCVFSNCEFKLSKVSYTTLSIESSITKCTASYSKFEFNNMSADQHNNIRMFQCVRTRTPYDNEYTFGKILTETIIGYKKAIIVSTTFQEALIKLEIPKGAIVFQPNNYKCRTNIAKVLCISNLSETFTDLIARSWYDSTFMYHVGETINCNDFELNNTIECAEGIHFFLDKESALNYNWS